VDEEEQFYGYELLSPKIFGETPEKDVEEEHVVWMPLS
jgi:hypothetical protein